MSENSKIAWTENTWSPWWGCREISPACQNCYAKRLSHRFGHDCWGDKPRLMLSEAHWRKPLVWNRKAEREGRIIPVFPSMCDPFEDRPELVEPRKRLTSMIARTPNLFWLLLTKRPENIHKWPFRTGLLNGCIPVDDAWPNNVGLGVTVENNDYRWRVAKILEVPAALYFLSAEPLLGELNLASIRYRADGREHCIDALRGEWSSGKPDFPTLPGWGSGRLGWVIVGTESGPRRRPTDIAHIRSLRDQCEAAGIPFLLKQMEIGGKLVKMPLLDGRVWDEVPAVLEAPDA